MSNFEFSGYSIKSTQRPLSIQRKISKWNTEKKFFLDNCQLFTFSFRFIERKKCAQIRHIHCNLKYIFIFYNNLPITKYFDTVSMNCFLTCMYMYVRLYTFALHNRKVCTKDWIREITVGCLPV